MLAIHDIMDRRKGGEGGVIVNVLSNLCLENMELKTCLVNDQQFLVNKQMLISLTEVFAQNESFEETGVSISTMTPVISKDLVERNYEWIKQIGLETLVNDIDNANRFRTNNSMETSHLQDQSVANIFDLEIRNFHHDNTDVEDLYCDEEYYYQDYDLELRKRSRSSNNNNVRRVFNKLCFNMVRGIEKGYNGSKTVVGLEGIKTIDKQESLCRL